MMARGLCFSVLILALLLVLLPASTRAQGDPSSSESSDDLPTDAPTPRPTPPPPPPFVGTDVFDAQGTTQYTQDSIDDQHSWRFAPSGIPENGRVAIYIEEFVGDNFTITLYDGDNLNAETLTFSSKKNWVVGNYKAVILELDSLSYPSSNISMLFHWQTVTVLDCEFANETVNITEANGVLRYSFVYPPQEETCSWFFKPPVDLTHYVSVVAGYSFSGSASATVTAYDGTTNLSAEIQSSIEDDGDDEDDDDDGSGAESAFASALNIMLVQMDFPELDNSDVAPFFRANFIDLNFTWTTPQCPNQQCSVVSTYVPNSLKLHGDPRWIKFTDNTSLLFSAEYTSETVNYSPTDNKLIVTYPLTSFEGDGYFSTITTYPRVILCTIIVDLSDIAGQPIIRTARVFGFRS